MVIDGWRIDVASTERQGMMAASYQLGYRLALICAGAGALYIAEFVNWRSAYLAMAALMASVSSAPCSLRASMKAPRAKRLPFAAAIIEPLADLFRRKGLILIPILALIACFRLPDFVAGVMANPLYIDLGFSKADIANVSKLYGIWVGIAGAFAGGMALTRHRPVVDAADRRRHRRLIEPDVRLARRRGRRQARCSSSRSASTISPPVSPARPSSPTCRA